MQLLPLYFILAAATVYLAVTVIFWVMDGERIEHFIEDQGGFLLSARWKPFAGKWGLSKTERTYRVRYLDRDCNEHTATFKTSRRDGVAIAKDKISRYSERWRLPTLSEAIEFAASSQSTR